MRPFDAIDYDVNSESDSHERRPSSSSSLGGNSEGRDVFHESDHDEMPAPFMENLRPPVYPEAPWSLRELNTNTIGLDVSSSDGR
jgi:hypothetical protein